MIVLVQELPLTGWLISNRNVSLTLEAGSLRSQCPPGSGEGSPPGCRWLTSHCVLIWKSWGGGQEMAGGSTFSCDTFQRH